MRERIILAPGANGDELLRSLAGHGIKCFNIRVMGAVELSRYALMRNGIPVRENFVSPGEECAAISRAVSGSDYFEQSSYADITDLTNAVRTMRYLVESNEEETILDTLPKGIFKEKNQAILDTYEGYLKECEGMDSVLLIRKAIAECKPWEADFIVLEEYPLKPLERKLVETLSENQVRESSLEQLFEVEPEEGTGENEAGGTGSVRIAGYKNCYGSANEVEMILTEIYENKSLDTCTVAVADPSTYAQLFYDYCTSMQIPVTFGCGIPIANSNPARLLNLYYRWMTTGLFGADALAEMIDSDAFDRKKFLGNFVCPEGMAMGEFYDLLFRMRFTNDAAENKAHLTEFQETCEGIPVEVTEELAYLGQELGLPCEEFLLKYARLRDYLGEEQDKSITGEIIRRLDHGALDVIYNELSIVRKAGIDQAAEDVITDVLQKMVCHEKSEPGKIHVCSIRDALTSVRENLYIAGLSADRFPGSPKENYLLLDADYLLFGPQMQQYTSGGRIKAKRDGLFHLVRLATSLHSNIYISYSGFNVSELKSQNASSMIFDLYKEEHGQEATMGDLEKEIEKVTYFEPRIRATGKVGEAYCEGSEILTDEMPWAAESEAEAAASLSADSLTVSKTDLPTDSKTATPADSLTDSPTEGRRYSPSALNDFFDCPRKYYYKRVIGLPEEEQADPFEVISAADQGTMAHSLMEELADSDMSLEEFLKLSGDTFDRFMKCNPAMIPKSVITAREQFLDMMENAYNMDPHRKVLLHEEDRECCHESGIVIHGFPDRVEEVDKDQYLIVDFKTGGRIRHEQDDIASCLQVVIYAYIMEQAGYHIVGGEFRYLRLGQTVTCAYDEEMKQDLNEMLKVFKEAVETNHFPCAQQTDDNDPCRYCSYVRLCNRNYVED